MSHPRAIPTRHAYGEQLVELGRDLPNCEWHGQASSNEEYKRAMADLGLPGSTA